MASGDPSIRFHWLMGLTPESQEAGFTEGDLPIQPMLIPPELGRAHFEVLQMPFGTQFIKGVHHFTPAAAGRLIPLGRFHIAYPGPTFIVQTIRGGRACQEDEEAGQTLVLQDGQDLFCHLQERHGQPWLDGSSDTEMVSLCMSLESLETFLGAPEAQALLEALGLAQAPAWEARAMPRPLGTLLHAAMAKPLAGPVRKLFAQAKALEYLSALAEHCHGFTRQPRDHRERERARALRDHLLALEGKLPTLEALARTFGIPARRLNAEFTQAYGDSIFAFIAGHRLDQAREALLAEDVPMKVLADRLGYSHVNNFSNAFRRRFGQAPGSLRRKGSGP